MLGYKSYAIMLWMTNTIRYMKFRMDDSEVILEVNRFKGSELKYVIRKKSMNN